MKIIVYRLCASVVQKISTPHRPTAFWNGYST